LVGATWRKGRRRSLPRQGVPESVHLGQLVPDHLVALASAVLQAKAVDDLHMAATVAYETGLLEHSGGEAKRPAVAWPWESPARKGPR